MKRPWRERQKASTRRFAVPADATRELYESFNRWTKSLSQYGLQITFALIAANWAIHGPHAILENRLAKVSIAIAILYLAVYLVLLGLMVVLTRRQHSFADNEKSEWAEQYRRAGQVPSTGSAEENIRARTRRALLRWFEKSAAPDLHAWPYTPGIQTTGALMRRLHVLGPFASGLLLVASIWYGSDGEYTERYAGELVTSNACCSAMSNDVLAIRRSIDQYVQREPSPLSIGSSGAQPAEIMVSGRTDFEFPSFGLIAAGLLLLSCGAGMLFLSQRSRIQAAGASLATIGALSFSGGGLTLLEELKVDSIFSIKTEKLFELVRKEVRGLGGRGPERIAEIQNFVLGAPDLIELGSPRFVEAVEKSPEITRAVRRWIENRTAGQEGVLLVIGGTDRLRLSGASERQFEANFGLARARGEAVKTAFIHAVIAQAPQLAPKTDQVIVLVSGPSQTPSDSRTKETTNREGYPQDRRVDIWALWTAKHEELTRR